MQKLVFEHRGRKYTPQEFDPMSDRKSAYELLWLLLVRDGERDATKMEQWGKPGWELMCNVRERLHFLWPSLATKDADTLSDWCRRIGQRSESLLRLGDARERRSNERAAPGRYFIADQLDTSKVPQYRRHSSGPTKPKKLPPEVAQKIADLEAEVAAAKHLLDEAANQAPVQAQIAEQEAIIEGLRAEQLQLAKEIAAVAKVLQATEVQRDELAAQLVAAAQGQVEYERQADLLREQIGLRDQRIVLLREQVQTDAVLIGQEDVVAGEAYRELVARNEKLVKEVYEHKRTLDLLGRHLELAQELLV